MEEENMDTLSNEIVSPDKQDKYRTLIEQTKATRFKPHESGNPGGKPEGKSITAELRKLLDKGELAEDIAGILIDIAKSKHDRGQIAALKELLDRTDGKVPDTHKIESDIPVIIQPVVYERKEDAKGTSQD